MKKNFTIALLFIFSIGCLTFGFHEHKKSMEATDKVLTMEMQIDKQSEIAYMLLLMAKEQSEQAKARYEAKANN